MNNKDVYPKTDFFNFLGEVDVERLITRVREIPDSLWSTGNNQHQNKGAALGSATHIIFRFIKDFNHVYDFEDRELWPEWSDDLSTLMHQAARSLGYENYKFPRIMLAKLPAGASIHPHIDNHASYYIHKIHIPLLTNTETLFHVAEEKMHMEVGKIIEVNNKKGHAVYNNGASDRIHLIFECYNQDDYNKPGK
ncbi:MAG: aspartyl/asparaginyl beta-hydroxylase domain-containing protein [Colwellia sp.]|nr:aspartyl/asparaginyl beta-hydroxylase domain-containing protein [Colwellia sp.]